MRNNKLTIVLTSLVFFCITSVTLADNGLISKQSKHSAVKTIDRLEAILKEKGLKIISRVSHSNNAAGVDIKVRPTELIIFGNPKLGSNLMTSNQAAGIDLPMKALAWEDDKGQVWLTYNDPSYITSRHGIKDRDEVVKKMTGALDMLTSKAVGD